MKMKHVARSVLSRRVSSSLPLTRLYVLLLSISVLVACFLSYRIVTRRQAAAVASVSHNNNHNNNDLRHQQVDDDLNDADDGADDIKNNKDEVGGQDSKNYYYRYSPSSSSTSDRRRRWKVRRDTNEVVLREDDPRLCVIVRTSSRQEKTLPALIYSLLAGDDVFDNMKIVLVDTETTLRGAYLDRVVDLIDDPRVAVSPRMLKTTTTATATTRMNSSNNNKDTTKKKSKGSNSKRTTTVIKENSAGYEDTNAEIERLSRSSRYSDDCDYYLLTNGDNMYDYDLIPLVAPLMHFRHRWISFNFTTHHAQYSVRTDGLMDLGSVVFRASVVTSVEGDALMFRPFSLVPLEDRDYPWHDSDYLFFRNYRTIAGDPTVLKGVHFFHL